ncbi:MAG TPA: 8-oxoguanine deaminase [bacterium]|nr:8-oxoguanine deaminase [bacterium]
MGRILIEGCETVVTMDDARTEIPGGSILIDGGTISGIGPGIPPRGAGTARVDGRGTVALPGLINTHHHLYQTLTRVRAQDQRLFGWLRALYPVWAGLDEEWERAAARAALVELALSGCSTTADHHYLFPAGSPRVLAAEVDAARDIGLRFHPSRGSMDRGESQGGLPPDSVVQDTDTILADTEEVVRRFHDPSPGSMLRLAVAPCSPFSVSDRLMRESAALARRLGVRLHTHIAETPDEEAYCTRTYGCRPLELLDDLDWLGPDVWLAHCVHLATADIQRMAQSGVAVAWCPTSNLRLGSGIAPVSALREAAVPVGLAVDGSASNDAGHMLAEARLGMLVARVHPHGWMSAREALWIATRGGASCLGRDDIGSLEVGKRADIALIPVDGVAAAGAEADLVAAAVYCAPQRVRHLFVNGRSVVHRGRLVTADEDEIAETARRLGRRILARSAGRIPT